MVPVAMDQEVLSSSDAPLTFNEQVIVMPGQETIHVLEMDASLPSSGSIGNPDPQGEDSPRTEPTEWSDQDTNPTNPSSTRTAGAEVAVEVLAPVVHTVASSTPNSMALSQSQTAAPVTVQASPQILTPDSLTALISGLVAPPGSVGQPLLIPLSVAGSVGGQGGLAMFTFPTSSVAALSGLTTATPPGSILKLPFAGLQAATVLNTVQPQLPTAAQTIVQPQPHTAPQTVLQPQLHTAAQAVLQPQMVQTAAQTVLQPQMVQTAAQTVLQPQMVQTAAPTVLQPQMLQTAAQTVLQPQMLQTAAPTVLQPQMLQTAAQTVLQPQMLQTTAQTVLQPQMLQTTAQTFLQPQMLQTAAQTVLQPQMLQTAAQTVLQPQMLQTGAQTVLQPQMLQTTAQTVLQPQMLQTTAQTFLQPQMLQTAAQTVLQPQMLQTAAQTVLQPQMLQTTAQTPAASAVDWALEPNSSVATLQTAGLSFSPAIFSVASLGQQPQFISSLTTTPIFTSAISGVAGLASQIITDAQGQVIGTLPFLLNPLSLMGGPSVAPAPPAQGLQVQNVAPQLVLNAQGQIISIGNGVAATIASAFPNSTLPTAPAMSHAQGLGATGVSVTQSAVVIAPQPSAVKSVTCLSSPVSLNLADYPTVGQLVSKPQYGVTEEDGINLEEIREFAKSFKIRRISLGLTQTQVGQALTATEGPAYSQSAICRFEKLDITPKSAQKLKPVLERWLAEAELWNQKGQQNLMEFVGGEPSKKRKRRTSFTPQAIEALNAYFEKNTLPTGQEITEIAKELNYDREVVRVWFCNRRQTLKNTSKLNVFSAQ